MMRVILLNRFYRPSTPATAQLLSDLAESFAQAGHSVTVISTRPAHGHAAPREECNGVHIIRIRSLGFGRANLAAKALAFFSFAIGACFELWRNARENDVIVALTDPPLIGIVAAIVARSKGARLVHWVHDIYPEVAVAVSGLRILNLFKPARNWAWRSATSCVALSESMADVLRRAGVSPARIVVVPNWAPAGLRPQDHSAPAVQTLRREWNLTGKFVVAYSGNLGRVHDLQSVFAIALRLRHASNIVFLFIGTGSQHKVLENQAQEAGLDNLRFVPPQSREFLSETLGVGDLHLVTLRPGCEDFVFPSKLYGIAAVGRATLVIAPQGCELAQVTMAAGLGYAFDSAAQDLAAAAILKLAENPTALAKFEAASLRFNAEYSVHNALKRWHSLLASIGTPPTSSLNSALG